MESIPLSKERGDFCYDTTEINIRIKDCLLIKGKSQWDMLWIKCVKLSESASMCSFISVSSVRT